MNETLFDITQGLYILGAQEANTGRFVGSCIDAVMVAQFDPPKICMAINKGSFTAKQIQQTKKCSLSVLGTDTTGALIKNFGFQTSAEADKWAPDWTNIVEGLPILRSARTYFILEVEQMEEMETHYLVRCLVKRSENISTDPLLTYEGYRKNILPTFNPFSSKWVCVCCGYVYDGSIPFEDLPDDYICPVCGQPKSAFEKREE